MSYRFYRQIHRQIRRQSQLLLILLACAQPFAAQAAALLEISEFSKPGDKKTVPLTSDAPALFNIEFFEGWSHCEVSASTNSATRQATAWMRCFSQDDVQVGLLCQGNDRQTAIFGHKDNGPKRGSLSLVCSSD